MRIHTDTLTLADIYSAALIARADADVTKHKSRSRARAFNVILRGESRRKPNYGTSRSADRFSSDKAATWDQWGVFLAVLFEADPDMVTPYYRDAVDFAAQTGDRFGAPEDTVDPDNNGAGYVRRFVSYGWPEDAHGDHTFRFVATPYENSCTKCTAVKRWGVRALDFV